MEKPPYSSSSLLLPLLLCSLQFEMRSLKRLASYEPEEEDDDWKADELDAVKCLLLELEPFFRSVLQEELQRLLSLRVSSSSIRDPSGNQIQAISAASRWRLSFVGELPDRLFTGGKIETRDGTSIKIFIEDRSSGSVVSFGALSAARVEIVVLDGDFDGRDQAGWTERDFADGVVKEREGRRPLLAGDVTVGLRGGAATLGPLFFTDNSSWTRSRKFRLGARVLSSTAPRVLEAVSGAFTVKDHRGELYKKHHPPALDDQVWRLERIGKHGAFHRRLSDWGITTVRDFMRFLVMDPDWLRGVLGMTDRVWKATVDHAGESLLDGKLFSYYARGDQVMLVFDSIFQLVGAKFDGCDFQLLGDLDHPQRALVNRLKQLAYENRGDFIEVNLLPGVEAPLSLTPWSSGEVQWKRRLLPRSRWVVLMAALKCCMFIRRRIAARGKSHLSGFS